MKLRALLSSTTTAKTQILAAGVSGISLLIATWISTLQIPRIQETIANEDAAITELRNQTTKDLVQGLYAADINTDRRIDLLDVRLETIMVSSRSKREQLLLESAARKTIDQIKQWDSLFVRSDAQPVSTPIPVFNESTSAEQKLIGLDSILSSARKNAYSRLEGVVGQIHTRESQRVVSENALSKRQVWFRVFQMSGLLSLVLAIVLESHKKYKETDVDEKRRSTRVHVVDANNPGKPSEVATSGDTTLNSGQT